MQRFLHAELETMFLMTHNNIAQMVTNPHCFIHHQEAKLNQLQ